MPAPASALLSPPCRTWQLPYDLQIAGWAVLSTGGQWRAVHRDGRSTPWRSSSAWVTRDLRAGRVSPRPPRPRRVRAEQLRLFPD
ncbi:MAG TPA: hypothetical protein VFS21_20340 [Roseiflexaceae bacterium]|nr:hypothetical protein [Roseiflexaceae bacterium]